jgi:hypothetical protein
MSALRRTRVTVVAATGLAALSLTSASAFGAPTKFEATGTVASTIQPTVDAFRVALGANNGVGGTFPSGRREINWDGVPDPSAAPNSLAPDFFNVNSPRGVVFSTPGTGFQVSANAVNPTNTPIQFGNIDASYPGTFEPFSQQRLFTALGSTVVDVNFFIPGTSTPAFVRGFGAVFSDVDLPDQTTIQFFGPSNVSLGSFSVLNTPGSQTYSFLGVLFEGNFVGRVRITNGTFALGAGVLDQNGFPNDLVVMDDFIYGEPSGPNAATFRSFSGRHTQRGVVLRWRTAQEVGSVGFNVYRGTASHRVRLNRTIVRAQGSVAGSQYVYRDTRAPRHSRLRYWLEEVGTDGSRHWRGPLLVST